MQFKPLVPKTKYNHDSQLHNHNTEYQVNMAAT
jgi:hypothetical protein